MPNMKSLVIYSSPLLPYIRYFRPKYVVPYVVGLLQGKIACSRPRHTVIASELGNGGTSCLVIQVTRKYRGTVLYLATFPAASIPEYE